MNSIEQAAKALAKQFPEAWKASSYRTEDDIIDTIAKHLDAFAREQSNDNARLLEVNRLAYLQLAQLKEQIRELLKDKERLDWLDSLSESFEFVPANYGKTIRQALDKAALAKGERGE